MTLREGLTFLAVLGLGVGAQSLLMAYTPYVVLGGLALFLVRVIGKGVVGA